MTTPPDTTTCALVIVGGAGAVGAMLAESARAEGDSVTVVDPAAGALPGVDGVCGDVTDPDPQVRALLAEADVVILAVPEAVAVAAVPVVDGAMKPGAVLVETLSVKSEIHRVLRTARRPGRRGDQPAVRAGPRDGRAPRRGGDPPRRPRRRTIPRCRDRLGRAGGHDERGRARPDRRGDAGLTHAAILAFGLALGDLGIDADTLVDAATPPHTTLLALLGRVAAGQAEVYHDIQAGNPQAAAARAASPPRCGGCPRPSNTAVHANSGRDGGGARTARDHLDRYRALCADLFTDPSHRTTIGRTNALTDNAFGDEAAVPRSCCGCRRYRRSIRPIPWRARSSAPRRQLAAPRRGQASRARPRRPVRRGEGGLSRVADSVPRPRRLHPARRTGTASDPGVGVDRLQQNVMDVEQYVVNPGFRLLSQDAFGTGWATRSPSRRCRPWSTSSTTRSCT